MSEQVTIEDLRVLAAEVARLSRRCAVLEEEAAHNLAQREALHAALRVAVSTIRTWQGMGLGDNEPHLWALYQASPEMQQINQALAFENP